MSIYETKILLIYCCVMAGIIGAVFGSFLNCAAWRIAHQESFVKGYSHCPTCGHRLGIPDLFPIISWIALGGKCRYCKTKVSVRYPLTEAFMALMCILCLLCFDLSAEFVRNFAFGCCLFTLSLIDLDIYEIPDGCHIFSIVIWLAALPFTGSPLSTLKTGLIGGFAIGGGLLIISLLMDKILGKESLGGGDIKLVFCCGLYLGIWGSLFMIFLACIIGLIFVAVSGRKNSQGQFPFGPSIALASWIMLLYGGYFIDWYLSLF